MATTSPSVVMGVATYGDLPRHQRATRSQYFYVLSFLRFFQSQYE
jgi:hypothetical protein